MVLEAHILSLLPDGLNQKLWGRGSAILVLQISPNPGAQETYPSLEAVCVEYLLKMSWDPQVTQPKI